MARKSLGMAVYADHPRLARAKQKKASSYGFYTNGSKPWPFEEKLKVLTTILAVKTWPTQV